MRAAWILAALASVGCSAALRFDQCQIDADCAGLAPAGGAYYCTSDRLCVDEYPHDRIECMLDATSAQASDAFTLGALVDRSRDADVLDGARVAIAEINTLDRRPLRLVICETHGVPAEARSALAVLAKDWGAIATLGPSTTAEVVAVADVARDEHIVALSSEAGGDAIDGLDDGGFVWRRKPSDSLQTKELAKYAGTAAKPVIAYSDDDYGRQVQAAMQAQLAARNTPVFVANAIGPSIEGDPPEKKAANTVSAVGADTAAFIDSGDPTPWVKALAQAVPPSFSSLLLTETGKTDALLGIGNAALLNLVTATTPALTTGPHVDKLRAAFASAFPGGVPTPSAGRAYDAIYALALGSSILQGRGFGDGVRQGMERLNVDGQMIYDVGPDHYQVVFDEMSIEGHTVRLNGVAGPLAFDGNGDVQTGALDVWTIDTTMPTKPAWKRAANVIP